MLTRIDYFETVLRINLLYPKNEFIFNDLILDGLIALMIRKYEGVILWAVHCADLLVDKMPTIPSLFGNYLRTFVYAC